jgi:hypothetical protein
VTAPAIQDSTQQRSANFFRGTRREREPQVAFDSLEAHVLTLVSASLEADARSNHRDLSPADLSQMLAAAKGKLRGMSAEDLRGISPSSLKSITDYSFSAVRVGDVRQANLAAAAALEQGKGADAGATLAARMVRMAMERERTSSARYSDLGGGERLSQSDLQNMAAARAAANDLGMLWALNNPELLKLGAGAIKTLHEAGVQRERFERITGKSVGFDASTAVEIAAFAKRHKLTPEQTNKLYDKISDGVEVISGGDRKIQLELRDATRAYVTGPDTPEAREALKQAWHRHAGTPEKEEAATTSTQALIDAAEPNRAAVAVENNDVAVRNATVVRADTSEAKAEQGDRKVADGWGEEAAASAKPVTPANPESAKIAETKTPEVTTPKPTTGPAQQTRTAAITTGAKPATPRS